MMLWSFFRGRALCSLILVMASISGAWAAEIEVAEVLTLGPAVPASPLNDEFAGDLLKANMIFQTDLLPKAGASSAVLGATHTWQKRKPAQLAAAFSDEAAAALVSFNAEVARFAPGAFKINWNGGVDVYLDGQALKGADGSWSADLTPGSHHVLLILTRNEAEPDKLAVTWDSEVEGTRFHLQPEQRVTAPLMFHPATVSQVQISPDGSEVMYQQRGFDQAGGDWKVEQGILDSKTGASVRLLFGVNEMAWSPDGKHLAMLEDSGLYHVDTTSGKRVRLLADTAHVGGLRWAPDGQSLFFQQGKDNPYREDGIKRYRAIEDRWYGWRNQSQIYQVGLKGWIKAVTSGKENHYLWDVAPDGKRILLTRDLVDYSKPPHTATTLHEMDLESGKITLLGRFSHLANASYTNNGVVLIAEPDAFDGLGSTLPADRIPNGYEGELYHLDPATGKAKALSKAFDPNITGMRVLDNGDVIVLVTDKDRDLAYHYQAGSGTFRPLPLDMEAVTLMDAASGDNPMLVFAGSSTYRSQRLVTMKLNDDKAAEIYDPAGGAYDQIVLGKVETWTFERDGYEIDGRLYTPPGFDADKKYPLLVYYYGGVSPVGRAFTGRYPFHLWAANGYLVYVMQPRGAYGYGQKFAADHVNAWGKGTAEDVIVGTQEFLKAHPYADAENVGCLGASYGGFMTMYLITRTNIFSAALSHAGISDLTGYWGYGWWGYAYNGVAAAGSFPWNRPEMYVDQSPIFAADKVETPLLLLHGTADTNVPVGQSHNMYTALKMLDKEVELVTLDGENHWILDHDKRLIWWDTMLAWFDRQLKDDPSWWDHLYPE